MDFFCGKYVMEEIFEFLLDANIYFFWVILQNQKSDFQIFTFSKCKDDLAGVFTSQPIADVALLTATECDGKEPHLQEPQHFALLLHGH